MNKDLLAIFEYLEREKGIKREVIISAIEDSLVKAAKKSIKNIGTPKIHIDKKTGEIEVFIQKTIVDTVTNLEEEISLKEAKELAPDCTIGQRLEISIPPGDLGRIAAQTARQAIAQKLREAEKNVIYKEYRSRVGEIISGTVKKFLKRGTLIVDLGKVEAVLPDRNYPREEKYHVGGKVLALLLEVKDTDLGGAEVILSRSHPEFVQALFHQEVPELSDGTISIEKIVREPGYRTKLAVKTQDQRIDPVGTCVGIRGTRIKNIIRELNNEKIDVIKYTDDKIELLKRALSPVEFLRLKQQEDKMTIIINDEDYPAVIGKRGMNARLLAKLLEIDIQIQRISDYKKLMVVRVAEFLDSKDPILDEPIDKIEGINKLISQELHSAGYDTVKKVLQADPQELTKSVPGVNYLDLAEEILER